MRGVKDFTTTSEQYLMHVDPGNHVLAITYFGTTAMPVAWTRRWGNGRVFYSSVGHVAKTLAEPMPLKMMTQGMLWASEKD
jgi:type 1 glutamine amidotransferase